MRLVLLIAGALAGLLMVAGLGGRAPAQQGGPFLVIYSGNVTVAGNPVPDGLEIVAFVGDLEVDRVTTQGGRYFGLSVGVPDRSYIEQTITFFIGDVQADQTDILLRSEDITKEFDFTFPRLPIELARTPTFIVTIPLFGDPVVPAIPPMGLLVGVVLVVVGLAALSLARSREER